MSPVADGFVEAGFEPVRDAFLANFKDRAEVGAACSLYVEGRKVVDLWGGVADRASSRPWSEETLCLVFSTTKGATALCANHLAEHGILDVDAPVASYWPEFARAGKEGITVRMLLCHQAGLPVIEAQLGMDAVSAWHPVVEALASQAPMWPPGSAHGYHALTYGWLVGETVRRASGAASIGAYLAQHVAAPLGLDLYIGLPGALQDRVATLVVIERPTDPEQAKLYDMFVGPETLTGKALASPSPAFREMKVWNTPELRAAEVPSANAVTDARSLARMYASTVGEVDGVRTLGDGQLERATEVQTSGADKVLFFDTKFGLGFMLPGQFSLYAGPGAFGHDGAGGSVGFADRRHRMGFGYVMNRMLATLNGDPRSHALIDAAYTCVGAELPSKTFA